MTDKEYMLHAIELAKRGEGRVDPNPLVGAVIVKSGKIIGEGWHERYGGLHAERNAIKNAKENARENEEDVCAGAVIYVTLEPCCHYGKTPPCTEAIIENRFKKVVIGSRDPNPLVSGKGVKALREAGIEVECDFLREECDRLNEVFFHYVTNKTPYVLMKYAMTADGKIATKTGKSKWISNEKSREYVQDLRNKLKAIMVGIGTVIADDPLLTCKKKGGRNPVRIICDSCLCIPISSRICKTAGEVETVVAFAAAGLKEGEIYKSDLKKYKESLTKARGDGDGDNVRALADRGEKLLDLNIKLINAPESFLQGKKARIDLKKLMNLLAAGGINSILLEGGGGLNWSALESGIVNEVNAFIAPKIFGGEGKTPVIGSGVDAPSDAVDLKRSEICMLGDDILLKFKVVMHKSLASKSMS